jgi:hypothetical protein
VGPTERKMRSTVSLSMILILSTILGTDTFFGGVTSHSLDTSILTAPKKITIPSLNLHAFVVFT